MTKSLFASLLLICALTPAASFASDGSITVSGSVAAPTCTINGGAPNFTVTLPTVSVATFTSADRFWQAGKTAFSITLTGCSVGANARAYFELGPNDYNGSGKYLKNNGTAQNVVVQLMSQNGSSADGLMVAGSANQGDFVAITNGVATLRYSAHYNIVHGSRPSPGTVTTSVTYRVEYQ